MDPETIQDIKRRYNIVGNCEKLDRAISTALQVAKTDLSVLVVGESGVGKEIIPRIIHDNSLRKQEQYFAINCGSIPEGTIDSELFGHEKGSFTGAIGESQGYFGAANKGTIFLDEVGELPLATQARLLRVLETGEYIRVGGQKMMKTDVRIVAATNVNMQKAIAEGRFREDLYYRLNGVPIMMPALRERGADIERLFRLFALQMADRYKMPRITLTDEAKQILMKYKWPGNVRQLKNITEQMSVISTKREIDAETIKQFIPVDIESTALATINSADDERTYANEREMLWQVIVDMKRTVDSMKAEIKNMSTQLNEQRGLAGARGFDTPTEEPEEIPAIADDSQPSHGFMEAEEIREVKSEPAPMPTNLQELSDQALLATLAKHEGNRKAVAYELGVSQRTLYRRLDALGIRKNKGKKKNDE